MDHPELDLFGKLYEAAVLPELWPGVLDALGRIAGCDKAVLYASNENREVHGWVANETAQPLMERFVAEGWAARNELAARAMARGEPDFSVDLDVFTEEEIPNIPLYRDFLIPNGLAWSTGTIIQSPSDDMMIVTIHRPLEQGPVTREAAQKLTLLRPHVSRAAFISTRLRLEQARMAIKTLEALGLPALALRKDRRIAIMNALFEPMIPGVAQDRQGYLMLADPGTDRSLNEALYSCERGKTFPVKSRQGTRYIGHLIPVAGIARDLFRAMDAILVLVEVGQTRAIDPRIIEGLFDLTPAEAAIAKDLAQGKTIDDIAKSRKTSSETVRSQVKTTMAKTGTSRQVDLVRLLATTQWPPAS